MEISFNYYSSIEEIEFDFGFKIIENLDNTYKHNYLFSNYIVDIKNINGKLLYKQYNKYNNLYVSERDYDENVNGICIMYDDDVLFFKDDYEMGNGLFELNTDVDLCDKIKEEFDDYLKEQNEENQTDIYYNINDIIEEIENNNNIISLNKNEIVKLIKKTYENNIKLKIEIEIEENKKKEELKQNEQKNEELILTKFHNGEDFFYNNKHRRWDYNSIEKSFSYYENDILKIKFIFKNVNLLDDYTIKNLIKNNGNIDFKYRFIDEKISFKVIKYKNDNGNIEIQKEVDIDFENMTFNNVKVAKNKIYFLFNKVYYNHEILTNKDIELYNKLSGIKVNVLELNNIMVDGLEFDIKIKLKDKNYMVEFMNENIIVEWNILKKYLTTGQVVYNYLNKKSFINFCKDIGINEDKMFDTIKKTKILSKMGE